MHFNAMTMERNMGNVSSKDAAVLWLWKAHNAVSDRISGDATDDPVFPKIKFPSSTVCPQCRPGFNFSEDEVLQFLKKIHSIENINQFGTKSIDENVTPQPVVYYVNLNEYESGFVPGTFSSIVVIGFCVCILLIVVLIMFIPRKKRSSVSKVKMISLNV